MADEKMDDDLKKIIIETSTDMKWMKNSLNEVKSQLKTHCKEIKSLKEEVSLTPHRVRDEVMAFLDDEFEKRDDRIGRVEKELSGLKGKVYTIASGLAVIVGAISSKAREILF